MTQDLPLVLTEVVVTAVDRLTASFVRVELGSDTLGAFGVDGPLYDQRIKLIFPAVPGRLPALDAADEDWFDAWEQLPEDEQGHMRTYTVREVRGSGLDRRVVVDFVLHLEPGASGPASLWAATAAVGDRLVLIGPRVGADFGGIEFVPGDATTVLLAGDETAVPAVAGILASLPAESVGAAFLEVPLADDVLDVRRPAGVHVTWLPRNGSARGHRLVDAVLDHLGVQGGGSTDEPVEVDPDLWETPTYSSSGESLESDADGFDGLYCWIAGEAGVVTSLRRHLVRDLGVDRKQVAFMGYWRVGVSMR